MAENESPVATLKLVVDEADLDPRTRGALQTHAAGTTVLSSGVSAERALLDALPSAIAKRVRAIVPEGFAVREIEIRFELGGSVFGVGLSGEVGVKLSPTS